MGLNFSSLRENLEVLSPRLTDFSKPLDALGIPFFTYARTYNDGTFLFLCNNPEWYRIKYEQSFLEFNGFVCTLDLSPNSFTKCIFTGLPNQEVRLLATLHNLGLWHSIDYYSYMDNFIETVHFGGDIHQPQLINFYLNHSEVLESFIYLFRLQFKDILEPPSPNLLVPLSDRFIQPNTCSTLNFPSLFPKHAHPITIRGHTYDLSHRQFECLVCFIVGMSAKETAKTLGLSHRTVEQYLQILKNKFQCHNLSALLSSLSAQQIFYLLSCYEQEHVKTSLLQPRIL